MRRTHRKATADVARKGQNRRAKLPLGDLNDPQGLGTMAVAYCQWMQTTNYSPRTVQLRRTDLEHFIRWCEDRGVTRVHEVTRPVIERYQRHLFHHRRADGSPLSFRSQYNRLAPLRTFFKWLARNHEILYNPASELELPRLGKQLPRHVLSAREAEQVMNTPDLHDPLGVRDRAILETFYSTGIRRKELATLRVYDLDAERGVLFIREGKGQKDRFVPIGQRAMRWTRKYLEEVRTDLVISPVEVTLFLTNQGEAFTPERLTQMVGRYVRASGVNKEGACHLFRHTAATLMLENGADIRYIQQFLGHAKPETTAIYTQVSITQLKRVHDMTHPARPIPPPRTDGQGAGEGGHLEGSEDGEGSGHGSEDNGIGADGATHRADDGPATPHGARDAAKGPPAAPNAPHGHPNANNATHRATAHDSANTVTPDEPAARRAADTQALLQALDDEALEEAAEA